MRRKKRERKALSYDAVMKLGMEVHVSIYSRYAQHGLIIIIELYIKKKIKRLQTKQRKEI